MTDVPYEVPENLYDITPLNGEERPYRSSAEDQASFMRLYSRERELLKERIAELDSRAKQIMHIYLCHKNQEFMAGVDRTKSMKPTDNFFYDWLDELYVHSGIPVAAHRFYRMTKQTRYVWDETERDIELCLEKGIDLETACKVANFGHQAIEMLMRHGLITSRRAFPELPAPTSASQAIIDSDEVEELRNDHGETEKDILLSIANATSKRDATMQARDRVSKDFVRVSAINPEEASDVPGYRKYTAEVQVVKHFTGEYTPYEVRVYFEESTPQQAIKHMLNRWSEALSRII